MNKDKETDLLAGDIRKNEQGEKAGEEAAPALAMGGTELPGCDATLQVDCDETWDCAPNGTEDCQVETDANCISVDLPCPSDGC